MRVIVTGATGFVGRHLCRHLRDGGHEVTALSHAPESAASRLPGISVSPVAITDAAAIAREVDGADGIINLAGASLAEGRWTEGRKSVLRNSRIRTTRALVRAAKMAEQPPAVLVSSSAVGFYGPRGDEPLDESDPGPSERGFLAELCRQWEEEALSAEETMRVVVVRTGMVLGPDGGALARMVLPFRMFVGGPLGSGRQWISWIHREDLVRLMVRALTDASLRGPVNGTSPEPVTNREFSRTLGRVLRRPAWAPVPAAALKLLFGEMSEVLLTGQRVLPGRAREAGFELLYPELEGALREILA